MFPGHWKWSSLSINRKFVFYYQLGRPVGIINCSICTVKVVNILLSKDFSCISRLCLAWKVQRLIWPLSMAVMNHNSWWLMDHNLWWLPVGRNIIYIMTYHTRLYLLVGICAIAKSYLGTESACATILHSRWTIIPSKNPKRKSKKSDCPPGREHLACCCCQAAQRRRGTHRRQPRQPPGSATQCEEEEQ